MDGLISGGGGGLKVGFYGIQRILSVIAVVQDLDSHYWTE